MPVHGEWRHLRANADLAVATGVPRERVVIAEDGVVVDLVDGVARSSARSVRLRLRRRLAVGDVTESVLKDRRILGDEGFISVVVVVDSVTGKVVGGPEIHARGFAEDDVVFDEVRPADRGGARATPLREGITDAYQLQQVVRRVVGQVGQRHATGAAR